MIWNKVEKASNESLPTVGGKNKKKKRPSSVAGWSEFVKPYAEDNRFWSEIWKSEGKPKFGYIFENMKNSQKQYTYAVRRLKKSNDVIQNDRFLNSLTNSKHNIFNEIKQFQGKQTSISSIIDDNVGPENIANTFANIYNKLYNKVSNGEDLNNVRMEINKCISPASLSELNRIDEKLIRKGRNKMKSSKRDALFDVVSDCYIHGPPKLFEHLTAMIRMFLVHGSIPPFILVCTLMPLVKDDFGDITSSNNYRAIAGGCLILKLLDIVFILLEGDKL